MSQTPNPRAYEAWNARPDWMTGVRYTANQWEDIHAWLDSVLRDAYQRGREDAARDVQALVGYSYAGSAPLVGLDTAIAAARGDGEQ